MRAMPLSKLELFRLLTSFSPKRVDLKGAPWDALTDWLFAQGLAPLAAYNLEYRLGATQVPEWVRHRLLSLFQGSANDNVMKLVNLKQSLAELEGRRIVMLGGVSYVESLYPHVAFRPVVDVRVFVGPMAVEPLATWLRRAEFKAVEGVTDAAGAAKVLSDTRTEIFIHGALLDDPKEDAALLSRAIAMRPFGVSAYRLELEDALLTQVLLMSRQNFEVPVLEFLDLRELVLGAPDMGGAYSRPLDVGLVQERAKKWNLEAPLRTALDVVELLWPETTDVVTRLKPSAPSQTTTALETLRSLLLGR